MHMVCCLHVQLVSNESGPITVDATPPSELDPPIGSKNIGLFEWLTRTMHCHDPCCHTRRIHLQGFRSICIRASRFGELQESNESWLGECGSANTLEFLPTIVQWVLVLIFLTMPCAMLSLHRPHYHQWLLMIRHSKLVHLSLLIELPVHYP